METGEADLKSLGNEIKPRSTLRAGSPGIPAKDVSDRRKRILRGDGCYVFTEKGNDEAFFWNLEYIDFMDSC